MKYIKYMVLLILTVSLYACDKNDDDMGGNQAESFAISTTTNSGPVVDYDTNAMATMIPLSSSTGFDTMFRIQGDDALGNTLTFTLPPIVGPTYAAPATGNSVNNISNLLSIQGVNIDQAAANSITYTLQQFGPVGTQIKLVFSGVYYIQGNTNPNTINGTIDIIRP